MPEAALAVSGLVAGYGSATVLRGLDLTVPSGGCVCLLGPNGAGKTTTMRTLAGMIRQRDGRVTIFGEDASRLTPDRRLALGLAMVPEGRRVFADLSVEENLAIGAYRRRGAAEVRRDREHVLALFPRLSERLAQAAGTLSGGEQQMLAIGRALMTGPRLLLLDEPSMGLAPLAVRAIFGAIASLNREGLPILLAEQNARVALGVAASGVVLAEGRVALEGPSAVLSENPSVREAYLGV